jgi:Domain of unknown function (DUF4372)
MAFAQLTWRELLRDIEACLAANQGKLFHMGAEGAAGSLDAVRRAEPARLAHLYVVSIGQGPGDTGPGGKDNMYVFDVDADNKLSNGKLFSDFS